MRRESVVLQHVLDLRYNAQVPRDMESAHETTPQRNDVIDLVRNSCVGSHLYSKFVERSNGVTVCPRRHSSSLAGVTPSCLGVHSVRVLLLPLSERSSANLLRSLVTLLIFGSPVGSVEVLLRSFQECVRITLVQTLGLQACFSAICLNVCVSLSLLFSQYLLAVRQISGSKISLVVCPALLALVGRSIACAFLLPRGSLNRSSLVFLAHSIGPVCGSASFLAFFVGHLALRSMCWSMIRRTSSAMEMPSRLASLIRNWRCGSVNEIICLTTLHRIPRGITLGYAYVA